MFSPAHDAVVLYAVENGTITESTDGITLAAFSLAHGPTSRALLGYTDLPQGKRGLNNSKGFAIGQQGAAYNKRGAVTPSLSVEVRPGSVSALVNLFPTAGVLPSLCLFVVVKGQYTDIYRYCKAGDVTINLTNSGGQGGEISFSVDFEAIAFERVPVGSLSINIPTSDLRALHEPLFWHDVEEFTIEPGEGEDPVSYRQAVMSLSLKQSFNLERKNQRRNWGDNHLLSRTNYALLEHTAAASGEIGLHEKLDEALFTAAANAQNWGDIVVSVNDAPVMGDAAKGFVLTAVNAFPSDETMQSGDANAEIDHTIPFTADLITFEPYVVPDDTP